MKVLNEHKGLENRTSEYIGFLGVSLGKPLFNKRTVIHQYCKYLEDNFSAGIILLADTPKVHNYMAIEGLSYEVAKERVDKISKDAQIFLNRVAAGFPSISIFTYNDLVSEEYHHNLSILGREYDSNTEFQSDCKKFVKEFLYLPQNYSKIKSRDESIETCIDTAVKYLLDELAFLTAVPFNFNKPFCEIYPGVHEIQEKLQSQGYDSFEDLKLHPERVFMEVHPDEN